MTETKKTSSKKTPAKKPAAKKEPVQKVTGAQSNNPCIPEPFNKKILVTEPGKEDRIFDTIIDAARGLKLSPYTVKVYIAGKVRAPRRMKVSYI